MSNKRSTVPQGTTGGNNGMPGSGTNSGATSTLARAGTIAAAPASSTFMPGVGATPAYSNVGNSRAGSTATAPASSTFMPAVGATPAYSKVRGTGMPGSGELEPEPEQPGEVEPEPGESKRK